MNVSALSIITGAVSRPTARFNIRKAFLDKLLT
jgi:hypothetical protein